MSQVILAIPCYNEEARLQPQELRRVLDDSRMSLLFVDDGSTDGTLGLLETVAADMAGRAEVLALAENRGKAEAVRAGLLRGIELGASVVGYSDADLATPVPELHRLANVLVSSRVDAVIGSRVATLGSKIDRSVARHYLGRVFATAASLVLGERIYDTQCGAKLFRVSDTLRRALAEPFASRWAFDVELLGRLLHADLQVLEVPLVEWKDVPGSKLRVTSMMRAGLDLLAIHRQLGKRR